MSKDITVVIPVYNEARAIAGVVSSVHAVAGDLVDHIVVVDDGSSDDTGDAARAAGATVIRHPTNLGYGAALKTGIRHASTPLVVMFDGDGQHRPDDIRRLHAAARDADMVVGARPQLVHGPLWRMPGKWLLSWMANYLVRRKIPDLNSGLRLLRKDVALRYLHVCPAGFSFTTTMSLALLSRGWRVVYVPIEVNRRTGQSTVSVATGLQTIVLILRTVALFDPLRVFVPASGVLFSVGVGWAIPYAAAGRGISVGSMLAIATAVILFGIGLLCDQISQLRLERFE